MRNIFALFPAWVTLLALANGPAAAEVGPCRTDSHHGLTCGQGDGAARAQLKKRIKDDSNYEFSLDSTHLKIDNRGFVRASATLWVPKTDAEPDYDMTLQVTRGDGRLGAKVLSIRVVPRKG
jgi:hypothetical protein